MANIYLNELDRFIKHSLKPSAYLRYGDDFILITRSCQILERMKRKTISFLRSNLALKINSNHPLTKIRHGLNFLGVEIYPLGRKLTKRNLARVARRLNLKNCPSYYGLIRQHSKKKMVEFNWRMIERLESDLEFLALDFCFISGIIILRL